MLAILYDVEGSTNVVEINSFQDIQKHINGYAGVLSLKDGYYAYDEEALIKGAVENKHLALENILPCKMYGPILYLTEGWKELPYESI